MLPAVGERGTGEPRWQGTGREPHPAIINDAADSSLQAVQIQASRFGAEQRHTASSLHSTPQQTPVSVGCTGCGRSTPYLSAATERIVPSASGTKLTG